MSDDGAGAAVDTGNEQGPDADERQTPEATGGLWGKRSIRIAAPVAAALIAAGLGVGVTSALHSSVSADAKIPQPPAKNGLVVENNQGDDETLLTNVVPSEAGVVRIRSAGGTDLGSGFVITSSGFVLAAYHGLPGAGQLTGRVLVSGKTYPARLVGSDPTANLALLQLAGTGFKPVKLGTAADLRLNDRVASAGGTWATKGVTVSTGTILAINTPIVLDGQRLTGLLKVSSLAAPASELGGPLFSLSGQVLGLSIARGTAQENTAGYVMPIDSALQIARQIAGQ